MREMSIREHFLQIRLLPGLKEAHDAIRLAEIIWRAARHMIEIFVECLREGRPRMKP
jgi:hypothetical protein